MHQPATLALHHLAVFGLKDHALDVVCLSIASAHSLGRGD